LQTVAGKTGTCIGQGGWLGLFTSYAPLANPRLAVVVITRGSDARGHFPAAVAGRIYRDLNTRFGTPVNMPLATAPQGNDTNAAALNEEEKEAADAEAAENNVTDDVSEANRSATASTVTTVPRPNTQSSTPRNTVKRVLMPIERRPTEIKKAEPQKSSTTTETSVKPPTQPDDRPRRTHASLP
jgi:hypothetical protein